MDYLHNKIHHIKYIKSQHKLEEKKHFIPLFLYSTEFSILMPNIDIVLDHSISTRSIERKGFGLCISSSEPESTRACDDRHLSHL